LTHDRGEGGDVARYPVAADLLPDVRPRYFRSEYVVDEDESNW